jgi:hypothetical protein
LKLNSPKDIKVVFKQEQVFVIKKILIKKRFSGFGKKKKIKIKIASNVVILELLGFGTTTKRKTRKISNKHIHKQIIFVTNFNHILLKK